MHHVRCAFDGLVGGQVRDEASHVGASPALDVKGEVRQAGQAGGVSGVSRGRKPFWKGRGACCCVLKRKGFDSTFSKRG